MSTAIKRGASFLLIILLTIGTALAAPKVELTVTVEKDVTETNAKGEAVTRRVVAADAGQGDVLYYTIRFNNSGNEVATNVQLDNPIAEGSTYKADSAWGDNATILFSIDNGKNFKKATEITYQVTGSDGRTEKRRVEPEKYSAIRWVIKSIQPGTQGQAGFTVQVN